MPAWQTDGNPDADIGANSFLGTRSANDPLRIRTGSNVNNADAMTITPAPNATATGNVGIGTPTPGARLTVAGGGATVNGVAVGTDVPGIDYPFEYETVGVTDVRMNLRLQSPNLIIFHTGDTPTPKMAITEAGSVGIGTPTPGARLHVRSDPPPPPIREEAQLRLESATKRVIVQLGRTGGNLEWDFGVGTIQEHEPAPPNNDLWFGDFTAYRLVIQKGTGNVGIGTTPTAARLSVNGDVEVTGDIRLLNADCAEDFDVAEVEDVEPGTVMVIDEEGAVKRSQQPYDKRVAGVVSGAGSLKPGIILDKQESNEGRLPVALIGKVACKVDARYAPIEVGDLLTTSPTAGFAMKAEDSRRAFGAVLGKALRALNEGTDTIPVMVALQ